MPPLFSACAEGTLKLVIAKAMTKLDGALAESSAVHRKSCERGSARKVFRVENFGVPSALRAGKDGS